MRRYSLIALNVIVIMLWGGSTYADYLWVPNFGDDTVSKIDISSQQVVATIPVGASPGGIAVDSENVYVTHRREQFISVIDKATDQVVRQIDVSSAMGFAIGVAVDADGFVYAVGRLDMDSEDYNMGKVAKFSDEGTLLVQESLTNIDVQIDDLSSMNSIGIGINEGGWLYIPYKSAWLGSTGMYKLSTQNLLGSHYIINRTLYGYRGPSVGIDPDGNGWTVGSRTGVATISRFLDHYTNPCDNPMPTTRLGVAVNHEGTVFAGAGGFITILENGNPESYTCVPVDAPTGAMSCDANGDVWVTFPSLNEVRKYDSQGNQNGGTIAVGSTPLGFGDMTGFEFFGSTPESIEVTIKPLPPAGIFLLGANVVVAHTIGDGNDQVVFQSAVTSGNGEVSFDIPMSSDYSVFISHDLYDPIIYSAFDISASSFQEIRLQYPTNEAVIGDFLVIAPLATQENANYFEICGVFDNPPPSNANVLDLQGFLEDLLGYNDDADLRMIAIPWQTEFQGALVPLPGVPVRLINADYEPGPGALDVLGDIACGIWEAGSLLGSHHFGMEIMVESPFPFCGGDDPTGYVTVWGQRYEDPDVALNYAMFMMEMPEHIRSSGMASAIDQVYVDEYGNMTGSVFLGGVFVEDRYEVPNCYYSGHLSHPNVLVWLDDEDLNDESVTLQPNGLGDYSHISASYESGELRTSSTISEATSFDPIVVPLAFPDENTAPDAVAVAQSDTLYEGEVQEFDGSFSSDPNGLELSYEWWNQDQLLSTEVQFGMEYPAGTHSTILKVTNSVGVSTTDAVFFYVQPGVSGFNDFIDELDSFVMLYQNFPNPFNPVTEIFYTVPTTGHVTLKIYDVRGRLVNTLMDGKQPTGQYEAIWPGRNDSGNAVASGVYFYRLEAGEYSETKRMVLIK